MKTLGLSKMGMNGTKYYEHFFNKLIDLGEEIKVETINTNNNYDYILFDGGSDVTPSLYNEKTHPETSNNILRDKYEENIFSLYKNSSTMFMGICRGSQFLNVMCGGTLFQHLDDYKLSHKYYHQIETCNTLLKYVPNIMMVNSTHHQAVKILGFDLIPIAVELKTRVIEAYESFSSNKIRAVQFHPEFIDAFPYSVNTIKWLFRLE